MVTIARHFNAGLNPQNIFKSRRDDRYLPDEIEGRGGNIVTFVLPSLRDSCRCRRIPGVEMPGYYRVVPLGRTRAEGAHSAFRRGNGSRRNQMQADGNSFPEFILGWTIGVIGV